VSSPGVSGTYLKREFLYDEELDTIASWPWRSDADDICRSHREAGEKRNWRSLLRISNIRPSKIAPYSEAASGSLCFSLVCATYPLGMNGV
jgi:hypothetical protein